MSSLIRCLINDLYRADKEINFFFLSPYTKDQGGEKRDYYEKYESPLENRECMLFFSLRRNELIKRISKQNWLWEISNLIIRHTKSLWFMGEDKRLKSFTSFIKVFLIGIENIVI